jgi:hypothetical protein
MPTQIISVGVVDASGNQCVRPDGVAVVIQSTIEVAAKPAAGPYSPGHEWQMYDRTMRYPYAGR